MKVKEVIYEDYVNYRKPSLFIGVCECDWKCCKEDSTCKCQNLAFANYPVIEVSNEKLISEYLGNSLTHAVVFGGLEPLKQWEEVLEFIKDFRKKSQDDIVIYTGYFPEEIKREITLLRAFPNIVMKFGRFRPNEPSHFDEVLGVDLPNKEQFGVRL